MHYFRRDDLELLKTHLLLRFGIRENQEYICEIRQYKELGTKQDSLVENKRKHLGNYEFYI